MPTISLTEQEHQTLTGRIATLQENLTTTSALLDRERALSRKWLVVEDLGRCLADLGSLQSPVAMANVAAGLSRAAWRLQHNTMEGWSESQRQVARLPALLALESKLLEVFNALQVDLAKQDFQPNLANYALQFRDLLKTHTTHKTTT